MMKRFFQILIGILVVILILLAGFMVYSNANSKQNSQGELKGKVDEEVSYLNSNLILLLNRLNGISYESYKVQTERIDIGGSEGKDSAKNSDSSSAQDSQSKSVKQSQMISSNILNTDRSQINWEEIKQTVETLYSSWAVIELDLHALNINSNDILSFSNYLKEVVQQIKNEDKANSLVSLANTYSTLARIVEGYEEDQVKIQTMYTKAQIINAYSIVQEERWQDCENYLKEAEARFNRLINDVSVSKHKQAEVNKVYVMIKEMQESVFLKDLDLFYINYKNVMQNIENMD